MTSLAGGVVRGAFDCAIDAGSLVGLRERVVETKMLKSGLSRV